MDQWKHVYSNILTPLMFLERSARVYPDKVAVVYGDQRWTYRELGERVNRLARDHQEGGGGSEGFLRRTLY